MTKKKEIYPEIKSNLTGPERESAEQLGVEIEIDPEPTPEQLAELLKDTVPALRQSLKEFGKETINRFPLITRLTEPKPEND